MNNEKKINYSGESKFKRERQSRIVRYLSRVWLRLDWEDVLDDLALIFWLAVAFHRRDFRLEVNRIAIILAVLSAISERRKE